LNYENEAMTTETCLVEGNGKCQLRIVRQISKVEVGYVAQYCRLVSADKLVEALGFPMITCRETDIITAELDRRLNLADPL
jgi:hypothetical protein